MITLKAKGINDALNQLQAYPAKLKAAQKALIEQATRYAAEKMLQQMASAHSIPQGVLIRHRRIHTQFGVVWVGYNPLPAGEVGNPIKATKGVYVSGHFYPGAFILRSKFGYEAVYARQPGPMGKGTGSLYQIMQPLDHTEAAVYQVADMTATYLGGIAIDTIRSIQ